MKNLSKKKKEQENNHFYFNWLIFKYVVLNHTEKGVEKNENMP